MKLSKVKLLHKSIAAIIFFGVISIIPNSFADELIQSITEVITEPDAVPVNEKELAAEVDQPMVEPGPSPSGSKFEDIEPKDQELVVEGKGPTATPSPSPSPSATPPHALSNQSMRIITPSEVSVDPRAHTVFLPKIYAVSQGDLLICAWSSIGSFYTNFANTIPTNDKSAFEIAGSNSDFLRVSAPGTQATEILNTGNGLKVASNRKSLAGSYLNLRFVALSEISSNPNLCNDGSASNTRTIYIRGLGIDLNITKSGITLK